MEYMKQQQTYDKNQGNIIDKSDEWYYNDKTFVSNSHLSKLLSGGPQHLKAYYEHGQKDTPAMIFGRAQHCLLFEPEWFSKRFFAIDDEEICEEIGGSRPRSTSKYKEWKEILISENQGKQEIGLEDMTDIKNMIDKAMSYKQVRELVESAYKKEVIYQKDLKGVKCKCKTDAINPSNFILDYKSTRHPATLFNWPKIERERRYNRQASFYKDITGVKSFWFIVQEKTYPYTVCLVEQSEESYIKGCEEYEFGLDMYKKHFIENPQGIDNFLEMGIL